MRRCIDAPARQHKIIAGIPHIGELGHVRAPLHLEIVRQDSAVLVPLARPGSQLIQQRFSCAVSAARTTRAWLSERFVPNDAVVLAGSAFTSLDDAMVAAEQVIDTLVREIGASASD